MNGEGGESPRPTQAEQQATAEQVALREKTDARYNQIISAEHKQLFQESGADLAIHAIIGRFIKTEGKRTTDEDIQAYEYLFSHADDRVDNAQISDERKQEAESAIRYFRDHVAIDEGEENNRGTYKDVKIKHEIRNVANISDEDIARYHPIVKMLQDELDGKTSLTDEEAESVRATLFLGGVRKNDAGVILKELTGLDSEAQKKVVDGLNEMREDEIQEQIDRGEMTQESRAQLQADLERAREARDSLPEAEQKKLDKLMGNIKNAYRLADTLADEHNLKRLGAGAGKLAWYSLVASWITLIWTLQLINKGVKKA